MDAGRTLRSAQIASGGSFTVRFRTADGDSYVGGAASDAEIIGISFNNGPEMGNAGYWTTEEQTVSISGDSRPRNIALLACIKS